MDTCSTYVIRMYYYAATKIATVTRLNSKCYISVYSEVHFSMSDVRSPQFKSPEVRNPQSEIRSPKSVAQFPKCIG